MIPRLPCTMHLDKATMIMHDDGKPAQLQITDLARLLIFHALHGCEPELKTERCLNFQLLRSGLQNFEKEF